MSARSRFVCTFGAASRSYDRGHFGCHAMTCPQSLGGGSLATENVQGSARLRRVISLCKAVHYSGTLTPSPMPMMSSLVSASMTLVTSMPP